MRYDRSTKRFVKQVITDDIILVSLNDVSSVGLENNYFDDPKQDIEFIDRTIHLTGAIGSDYC